MFTITTFNLTIQKFKIQNSKFKNSKINKFLNKLNMENTEVKTVEMSAEEMKQFRAFQEQQKAEAAARKEKDDRDAYRQLVEEAIFNAKNELVSASNILIATKMRVMNGFKKAIQMKGDLFGVERLEQYSHTFTAADGRIRIIIGNYTIDSYRDTVNEGVELARKAIEELATDNNSRALVNTVLHLLAKDKKGNLKASRVMQLEKTAQESDNKTLLRGVQIIKEAYQPDISKSYIRMEVKENDGGWKPIPLNITEA
jgi:hypothetical protein